VLKKVPGRFNGKHVTFEEWFAFELKNRNGLFSRLNSMRLFEIYASIFGETRVHVLLFEEMVSDRAKFSDRLATVIRADSNHIGELLCAPAAKVRPSSARIRYQALRSWFLPDSFLLRFIPGAERFRHGFNRGIDKGSSYKKALTDAERHAVHELFAGGNLSLDKSLNLGLARRAYPGFADSDGRDTS